jgi:hypothetical protein
MSIDVMPGINGRSLHNIFRRVWRRGRSLLAVEGFTFGRPLVVLQSDDWGRVGVRDREGFEELRNLGVDLGQRSYDFYSLETAEDVAAVTSTLQRHRDSIGRSASLGMNFVTANVDFARVSANNFRQTYLRPLAEGLPDGWKRPGLYQAYREGMAAGILAPALHGTTHFCRPAVERHLADSGERGILLRLLCNAGIPYIHWRMPWIGFEYWDSERSGEKAFLTFENQASLIGSAVESFAGFFSKAPISACAPGYRADESTHKAWAKHDIRVAQNGPGGAMPPHFDESGILHLYRVIDFEPAITQDFSVANCVQAAADCFSRGLPAIVSLHSVNFHSTLKDFRSRTLGLLDEFLMVLEKKYTDLLYVRDEDLYDLVDKGTLQSMQSTIRVPVTKRKFAAGAFAAAPRA